MIVVDWVVLDTPIVPEGNTSDLPRKSTGEFWLDLMVEQETQQRGRFPFRPAFEPGRMRDVDVQCLLPSFRVCPDDGVHGLERLCRRGGIATVSDAVLPRLARVGLCGRADAPEPREGLL